MYQLVRRHRNIARFLIARIFVSVRRDRPCGGSAPTALQDGLGDSRPARARAGGRGDRAVGRGAARAAHLHEEATEALTPAGQPDANTIARLGPPWQPPPCTQRTTTRTETPGTEPTPCCASGVPLRTITRRDVICADNNHLTLWGVLPRYARRLSAPLAAALPGRRNCQAITLSGQLYHCLLGGSCRLFCNQLFASRNGRRFLVPLNHSLVSVKHEDSRKIIRRQSVFSPISSSHSLVIHPFFNMQLLSVDIVPRRRSNSE